MNSYLLSMYQQLTKFLASVCGREFEIVLYWFEKGEVYIAALENSHISGRNLDSPMTEFGLSLIKNKVYLEKEYVTNFHSVNNRKKHLTSHTFFIKDNSNQLLGILGINHDRSIDQTMLLKVKDLVNIMEDRFPTDNQTDDISKDSITKPQVLTQSIEEIIYTIIDPQLLSEDVSLSQELKINIVDQLNQHDVFTVKGAVAKVADILNISIPSVYRYLKIVQDNK
ncbi:helix-turn-helix transcriptional regulator [Eremococcus coleocola]|uniref:YheO-like protein n=1 Tax=Eremococcus coleocola ACS-139-V-Col8 TaxID=908337 RepID=E4KNU0_9LACT|nr:PAS domain-containing protein [Eremococcus coleocola]EFR31159.1 YheO-like protein [Eremococcus coleocola ACS-139-V-Col8]